MAELRLELGRAVCEGCPAAEFIASVRGEGVEVPGVRCHIEHNTLSLRTDPTTVLRWCSQPTVSGDKRNGYDECPTWQYEKVRLWLGQHSLGDEAELERASAMQWREDLTGSPEGDLSIYEEGAAAAANTIATWQEQHAEQQGK
jgi:hypothetical protein